MLDIKKNNSVVATIMDGGKPTAAQLSELAPLVKIAEDCIKAVKAHIKERIEEGEEIVNCSMRKGAEKRSVPDANAAFWKLKDELGESFNAQAWKGVPKVSATDAQKFLEACGVPKKDCKSKLAELLGDNLKITRNASSLVIK